LLALLCLLGVPKTALGQQAEGRDSLEARIGALEARIEALEKLLRTQQGAAAPGIVAPAAPVAAAPAAAADTSAVDELAALRAAARAAAGGEAAADTAEISKKPEDVHFVGRTNNLNKFNPEISMTGDVRYAANRPGPEQNNVDLREFEFAVQSVLDPYATTKVFFTFENDEVSIEEGYVYWSGLPGGLRADVGRQRLQLGELNRIHLHALPQSEYPLVLQRYFGEEGLIGNGLSVYWLAPFASAATGTHEVWAQFTEGDNQTLFQGGNRLSVLGHLNNFWQVSPSVFFQLGGTALWGENPAQELTSRVLGANFRLSWRPPGRGLYRSFTLRGEGYAARQRISGLGDTRYGGYLDAEYQLSQRLFGGIRGDFVQPLQGRRTADWSIVPHLQWWQSEFLYLRAEWQHLSSVLEGPRATSDRFIFQTVWAMGPHKHEEY